jgi:hypothetical protein
MIVPGAYLPTAGVMASSLMCVAFFALGDGIVDFFPGVPIGGIPVTGLAGVSRANQRWAKNEPASNLVEIVPAALCKYCYERRDGKHPSAKEDDRSYAHRRSPLFDYCISFH